MVNKRIVSSLSCLLFLPGLLTMDPSDGFANAAGEDFDESQWTLPETPPPGPGVPSEGSPESDYGSPDRRRMDEERRKNVLDQLCRKLKLNKDFDIGGGEWPRTTIGFARRMEADLDGRLALIDEEELSLDYGKSVAKALNQDGVTGSLWVGTRVSGKSMVIRRLGSTGTCGEIKRLIDVTDIKTVLPIKTSRIQNMGVGELWRVPLTIYLGYGASLSDVLGDNGLSVSIGMSKGKSGTASMTLWRLSEKEARFRFRIDFIQVHSRALNMSKSFTPLEFATAGDAFLAKFLKSQVNRQLRKYVTASLGWGRSKSDGKRIVLEYTIDPTDPQQARAMAEALKGDLRDLFRLAARLSTSKTSREETLEAYGDLQDKNSEILGAPDYAALSEYQGRSRTFNMNIPLLVRLSRSATVGRDRVLRYTGEEGEFAFYNSARTPNAEYFDVPFMGPLVKDLEHRSVEVVTQRPKDGEAEDPIGIYIHNQGMLRLPRSEVARAIEDANAILRLAGKARDESAPPGMQLPVAPPPPAPSFQFGRDMDGAQQEPADQKGWMSFTLVMNQKAVRDALSASTDQVLKAFAAATPVGDRTMAEWLVKNGTLRKGRLEYDNARAVKELGLEDGGENWLVKMSGEAAGLVRDVAEAAGAAHPEARAELFSKIFSYRNNSGLKHPDVLRVLVQFMDPMDITGDFVSAVKGMGKDAPDLQAHYVLKKGRPEVPILKEAGETRSRFADGSILTD